MKDVHDNLQNIFYTGLRPVSNHKHKAFYKLLEKAIEVKHLGSIPGMKFLMDENCHVNFDDHIVINAKTFFSRCGLQEKGQPDEFLLKMATRYGYTIVTKDKGLVIYAYYKKIPIIYRLQDFRLFLLENNE